VSAPPVAAPPVAALPVAALQLDLAWEDPPATFARAAPALARAAAAGARLIALPELFATGFSMRAEAMAAHHDAVLAFCAEQAARHGVWLIAGVAAPAAPRPLNCAVLIDPEGRERGRYAKIHPFTLGGEPSHYQGGAALPTWSVEGVAVTPLVCYDLRFPELFRLAAAATDLFVVVANWPATRWEHWRTLLRARAIECQAYVLGVNRVGAGGGLDYRGDSALIGPFGERLAEASGAPAEVLGAVAPAEVAAVRARTGFLADRRPGVYAALAVECAGRGGR
jgi:predicted amidohydrolase